MAEAIAAPPGRAIHVVADAAYAGEGTEKAPAPHHVDNPAAQGRRPVHLPPQRTGKRWPAREKGDRLPPPPTPEEIHVIRLA